MTNIFPEPITKLPQANMPFSNYQAYLSQGANHQIIFMQFDENIDLPEHAHESQWGIVLEGKIELTIGGVTKTYVKGDRYFIEKNVKHSGKIFAGYADITFFNQRNRYSTKQEQVVGSKVNLPRTATGAEVSEATATAPFARVECRNESTFALSGFAS